ncbi:MCE family protein [Streptomyces sp. O3]
MARTTRRHRTPPGGRLAAAARALGGRRLAAILAVLVLLASATVAGYLTFLKTPDGKRVTAYFDRAVAVHPGSDVRVLGVRVGQVDDVRPEGERVRVRLTLDANVKLPADVRAVVVAPSVVSGRFVQLSPAYDGGPQAPDGTVIDTEDTATPVEVDELLGSVTELADALGPDGANKDGALADLVKTGAENLDGNGKAIGDTIHQLGGASAVLNGNSGDLVATVKHLQEFTRMLKKNDGQIRKAERQFADVARFLAKDKDELAGALKELGTALGKVKGFIGTHRGDLKANVDKLARLTQSVVDQRGSVAEALDVLPLAALNLDQAYNPRTRTIDGRANVNELAGALPLPAVGTVYGTPERDAHGERDAHDKGAR